MATHSSQSPRRVSQSRKPFAGKERTAPPYTGATTVRSPTRASRFGTTLRRRCARRSEHCIRFPYTKSGAQVRVLGEAAMDCVDAQPTRAGSPFVFPADWSDGHFIGVVRVPRLPKGGAPECDPHVLRHTFASVDGDLDFSELTIAGLLGHPHTASREGTCTRIPHCS